MKSNSEKRRILDQLLPPFNKKPAQIAKEEGVSITSIYLWRKEFGYDDKLLEAKLTADNDEVAKSEEWLTSEDKFMIVVETNEMTSEELDAYCSDNMLNKDHVLTWRLNCINANDNSDTKQAFERQQQRVLKRENRRLKRELNKKSNS